VDALLDVVKTLGLRDPPAPQREAMTAAAEGATLLVVLPAA
jgi:hypothetical protein